MSQENNPEKVEKKKEPLPKIENYLHPFTIEDLNFLTRKVECVFDVMKKKLEDTKPSLIIKPKEVEFKSEEFKPFFQYETELPKDASFSNIVDIGNFVHFVRDEKEIPEAKELKTINQDYLDSIFKAVKDKGTLILVLDFHHILQITECLKKTLGDNYLNKLFLKLYIIEKVPLAGILFVQKMSQGKESIKLDNEKILSYEIYDNFAITKPISYTMDKLSKSVTYMYQMYQYQKYLEELHPGLVIPIKVHENFYSENIECTLTIVDSNDPELAAKKTCSAIIVDKSYSNDFIYLSPEGNMGLCQQTQSSRVILILPAPFNFDSAQVVKERMSNYIILFKPLGCSISNIPVLLMSSDSKETVVLYEKNGIIVRDTSDSEKNETLRQLIFSQSPTEIQSEIKLRLTSKQKIKNEKEINYIQLPTIEKYSSKNLVSCFDDEYLCMFYIKTLLCSTLFIDLGKYPEENLNVLVLGAGIGTINYYLDKMLKSRVNIEAVELSKEITKVGKKYFATNNYDHEKENIKWHFCDAYKFIKELKKENYYDLIVIDINNSKHIEGISPPPCFFEEEILSTIQKAIKPTGMYVINLMARSYKNYLHSFELLEKFFPLLFFIQNSEDLNKIHFCFKTKLSKEEYQKLYLNNLDLLLKTSDAKFIEQNHGDIIKHLVDTNSFKKRLETYAKGT